MKETGQSERLTGQQKTRQGVVGILGPDAKLHDSLVGRATLQTVEALLLEYPTLTFRIRSRIEKKEIHEALQSVAATPGQTLFVDSASIIPDGGIVEVRDDNGRWRVVLISEAKYQGKDVENIKRGIQVGAKGDKDLMLAGNAIERAHKNIAEMANFMLAESHFPYILFLEGSNFLTQTVTIDRPDGRTVTLDYKSGTLNRIDRLTAAHYGLPINENLTKNRFVRHADKLVMLQAVSIHTTGDGSKWSVEEMKHVMPDVAKTSLKIPGSDLFTQLTT